MMNKIFLLIMLLTFSFFGKAQSLSTQVLLDNLYPFWEFIEGQRDALEKSTSKRYESVLEQSYDFIELELRDDRRQLYMQIQYKIEYPGKLEIYSFYCTDKKTSSKLEKNAKELLGPFKWDSIPKKGFNWSQEEIEYLQIADRILAKGNDLSARPSDSKSILITSDHIKLDQSNHMNSKSLDHKDSYLMRDLMITIPINRGPRGKEGPLLIGSYFFGNMQVVFNDGSAKSQQYTGDRIQEQIDIELKKYQETKDKNE